MTTYAILDSEITRTIQATPSLTASTDGFQAKYAAEARAFTGLTDESLRCLVNCDFINGNQAGTDFGTQSRAGGTFAVNQSGPGIVRIVGGAALQGGLVRVAQNGNLFISQQAKRFYAVCLFRIAGIIPNALSRIYFLVSTGCCIGFNGTNNATKFGFSVNTQDLSGAAPKLDVLSTQAPFVGALVTAKIYYDGDAVYGSMNGESWVLVATADKMLPGAAGASNDCYFDSFPATGSTQTDAVDIDYIGVWGET